jgi:hypothetical protein
VRFGDDALRLSRIHPRQANQHYFTRLNADPLPVPARRARNHADLVYLHLKMFQPYIDAEGGELLLAVPGIFSPDQLGVLLGVLQEVGVRVTGFVDAAVAALSNQPVAARAYHLDVMMQRAVVTAVEGGGDSIVKVSAQEVPEGGLNRLLEAWINVIADRFVRETRFDPLHAAATEQQLFNKVYEWIEHGAPGQELVVEIAHGDHTRRVELNRALLEDKAEQRIRQLTDAIPPGSQVFLSARSARLPGLRRTLEDLRVDATVLPDDALPRGCLRNLQHIVPTDGELRLVTRLPMAASPAQPTAAPADAPPERTAPAQPTGAAAPTHALQGHRALRLDGSQRPMALRPDGSRWMVEPAAGVLLNGEPLVRASELVAGDRVAVGEQQYLLIRVED